MTRNEAISKLLTWANAQIGTVESGDNWNKYAQNMAAAYSASRRLLGGVPLFGAVL